MLRPLLTQPDSYFAHEGQGDTMGPDIPALPRQIPSRVAASLLGGYVLTWGFAVLGIALLAILGMPFEDAYKLTMMLAFLVFLAAFCWTFAAASVAQVWAVLTGGGAVMTGAAWSISRFLS